MRGFGSWIEAVLAFFSKSGPWAVLCLLMIFGIAYELHVVIGTVGVKVTDYVVASADNLDALMSAQEKATEQRTVLQTSTNQLALALTDANKQITINGDHINQLQTLMQDAYQMMKSSVAKREQLTLEQTEILKRLEQSMAELNRLTLEANTGVAKDRQDRVDVQGEGT